MTSDELFYHAGSYDPASEWVEWSTHTRRTLAAARREASRMAARRAGQPVVEGWDRSWGLRPGDCDAVTFFEQFEDGEWVDPED